MSVEVDYIIVGHGIAGNSMAWHLHRRGYKIAMIHRNDLPNSSRVAAGIFNPLTGRKLVKTWLADTIFPYAQEHYSAIESALGIQIIHPCDLYRPYRNEKERDAYLQITQSEETATYVAPQQHDWTTSASIEAPLGGLTVTKSGWIDLPTLLDASQRYFEEHIHWYNLHFNLDDLSISYNGVQWNEVSAKGIILCQGMGAQENHLFNWLPFNPVKGQLMDVNIPGYDMTDIVNQGIFMLPLSKERVRVGATYSWHQLDWETTPDARTFLETKLSPLLKQPYSIATERAGIRPSTNDRRPFVGIHPEFKSVAVFNGLGTKGVTLAPYFANQFVNYLENKEEIAPEANISRHFSLYFHQSNA